MATTELKELQEIRKRYGKNILKAVWLPNATDFTATITVNDYCDDIESALKETKKLRKINCELLKQKNTLREENKKLQIIEEKFDIEVFEMKDLDGKVQYIIDIKPKPNKYSNMFGNSLTKEEYKAFECKGESYETKV